MPTYELAGRTALVTGGASGIGLASAELLARSGATVAINFLPDDPRGPEQAGMFAASGAARGGSAGERRDRGRCRSDGRRRHREVPTAGSTY